MAPDEVGNEFIGVAERLLWRQKDDAGMPCSRFLSETAAVHEEDPGFLQQSLHEDIIGFRYIEFRISVKRALWSDAAYAGCGVGPFGRQLGTGPQFRIYFDQVVLWAFESRGDRVHHRMGGTKARPEQLVNAFKVGTENLLRSADNAPSYTPTGGQIVL